jgi:hypothetical protein
MGRDGARHEADERRWPAAAALLTAWILPATTARRTAHTSLLVAWSVHLFAAGLTFLVVVFLVGWNDAGAASWYAFADALDSLIRDAKRELRYVGHLFVLSVVLTAVAIELGLAMIALFIAPWGARDEPIRASRRHALHRVWISNGQIPFAVAAVGIVAICAPPTDWSGPFAVQCGFIAALWLIWGVLRSVGAKRNVPPVDRPPLCEWCGYNLYTISMDSRCPECGRPVIDSLGPNVRPGTAWERRRNRGVTAAWRQCVKGPIRTWDRFGRSLRLTRHATAHRAFLAAHLPLIYLIGAATIPCGIIVIGGVDEVRGEGAILLLASSMFGTACVVGTIAVMLFAATLIGGSQSWREKRNLLPGAMQAACYLTPYLVAWAAFGSASGIAIAKMEGIGVLRNLAEWLRIRRDTLAFLLWFVPNVTAGVYYLLLVARVTWATRYANR